MSYQDAFKPCDIRGLVPEVIDERLFSAVGRALAGLEGVSGRALVAGDVRLSTPSLAVALTSGLESRGVPVTLSYPLPTPAAYYAGGEMGADLILVVTASHNPPRYNGLKMLLRGQPPSQEEMVWLARETLAELEANGTPGYEAAPFWEDSERLLQGYKDHLLILTERSKPLKVVVDPGSGCLCGLAATILREVGHEVLEVNGKMDGRFPGRGADPTAPGALDSLCNALRNAQADIGLAFDGDGDRVIAVDEKGHPLAGDVLGMLLALDYVKRRIKPAFVLDLRFSRALSKSLERAGSEIVWSMPGHAFLRRAMKGKRAVFGAELSGHYFFEKLDGGDDGLFAALQLCSLVSQHGSLAAMVEALPESHVLPELRLPLSADLEAVFDGLEKDLRPVQVQRSREAAQLDLDGAWVLARSSITEPLLAVRIEAESEGRLRELAISLRDVLHRLGFHLPPTGTLAG